MKESPKDVVSLYTNNNRNERVTVRTRDGKLYKLVVGVGLDLVPLDEEED